MAIRAGLTQLGRGMLERLLAADTGYRGPRTDCEAGHRALFVSCREKTVDTVLGAVTLNRAWYHCAACGHGLAQGRRAGCGRRDDVAGAGQDGCPGRCGGAVHTRRQGWPGSS